MLLFQFWVKWMHGSFVPSSFKAAVILLKIYTMLQILIRMSPFIIQFLEIGLYKVIGLLTYFFPFYRLVPSGDTEFAKDASFGYKSSNLREVCFCFFFFS